MKFTWFHLMPWPYLADDFRRKNRSVWVDIPNELYDPAVGHDVYHTYMDQLEYAESLGFDVEGCIYDVIRKPSLKRLEATPVESRKYKKDGSLYANQRDVDESPEEFRERFRAYVGEHLLDLFQRGEVVRAETELSDYAFDLWQTARLIREAELAERHPRNPDACRQWNRFCEYFDVCTGAASLDDATRFRKVESANEELENADPATAAE